MAFLKNLLTTTRFVRLVSSKPSVVGHFRTLPPLSDVRVGYLCVSSFLIFNFINLRLFKLSQTFELQLPTFRISWLFICFSLAFHGLNSLEIFIFQFIIAGFSLNCSWAAIDWVVKTELINKMTDRNLHVDAFTSDGARENNI